MEIGRKMLGATKPIDSNPGTLRGDFGQCVGRNLVHGSDGIETAKREIALWFKPEELCDYESNESKWIHADN